MALHPRFAKTVMECERLLEDHGHPSCLAVIAPSDGGDRQLPETAQLQSYQIAIFVLEIALARLFMWWGITPTVLVGHR